MTDINNSIDALFKPGISDRYFEFANPSPIYIGETNFNLWNAWWLAEISRLVYREDKHNVFEENNNISTEEILKKVGMEKIGEINNDKSSTYGLLIKAEAFNKALQTNTTSLVLAFRGTNGLDDWKINFRAYQRRFNNLGNVHSGFQQAFLSIKDELLNLQVIHEHPLFITGHSLGAALATLCTAYLSNIGINLDACYTYGSPRVGNDEFSESLSDNNIYRVINHCDIVTTVPFDFAAIQYRHTGKSCFIDADMKMRLNMSIEDIEQYQKAQLTNIDKAFSTGLLLEKIKTGEVELYSFLTEHAPINYVAKIEQNLKTLT